MSKVALVALALLLAAPMEAQQQARPTGIGISGLPAVNFDADEGFGYGATLQINDYGSKGAAPYRFSIQPTVFFTAKGRRDAVVFIDAPHALPGGWRLTAFGGRQQQLATPYYGIGNLSAVDDKLVTSTNPYYYRYGRTLLVGSANFQHQVGDLPSLRFLIGAGAKQTSIKSVPYDSGTTFFAKDFGNGAAQESSFPFVRAGLVFDTRDQEIGPLRGNWSEVLVQLSDPASSRRFTRITGAVRQYLPLGSRFTLAERVVMQTVRGSPSASELSFLQSSFRDDEALGGSTSIRGIPKNRYIGKSVAFSNTELRWSASEFSLAGRSTKLVLAGFLDAGRVWSGNVDVGTIAKDLHIGYGGGAHLVLGPTFIVTADVGRSAQTTAALYLGLGYLF